MLFWITRIRSPLALSVILLLSGLFAAAPASAEWTTNNGATKGAFRNEPSVFLLGAITINCEKAEGKWKIRKADTVQEEVLMGGHFNKTFETFTNCMAETMGGQKFAVTVSEYETQNEQGMGPRFISRPLVKVVAEGKECSITLPSEENLASGAEENSGKNIVYKSKIDNIASKGGETAPCKTLGVNGEHKGGEYTETGTGEEVKIVGVGPYWHVNGSRLESGKKQVKLQSKNSAVLSSTTLGLELECKNSISEGATIEGNGVSQGQDKGRLSYSSCKVIKPAGCTLAEPITTNPTKSYLAFNVGAQQSIVDVFEPTEGVMLAKFIFSGKACGVLSGAQPLDGSVAANIVPKGQESQENLFAFPTTAVTVIKHNGAEKKIGLTFAGAAATLSGAYGARLATGEKWGAFES